MGRKFSLYFLLTFTLFQEIKGEFECEENSEAAPASCSKILECWYDDKYRETQDRSRYCRCRTTITDYPLPNNNLEFTLFFQICSRDEKNLKELWVNDVGLEYIDNEIFKRYPNLKHVNLARNKLTMNFSEAASQLINLDLSDNELISVGSDVLDNLKSLKSINLSSNKLNKIDYSFKKTTNLEKIYLNNNELTSINPEIFSGLSKLKILDLSHNLLTSVDTNFCVYHLQELHLNHNKLATINAKELNCENINLSNFEDLKFLNLSNNELQSIDADFFVDTRIKVLDVSSNNLSHIDSNNFQNFKNMTTLNLGNNSLTEKIINCDNLQNLEHINIFYLSQNQITEIHNCTFTKMKKLTKLFLLANQIEKIPPSAFSALEKLEELNLSENRIREIPTGVFDNLKDLKVLNISHNRIANFDLNTLNNNGKITDFDIKYNNLKDFDLIQFKNQFSYIKSFDIDNQLIKCDNDAYNEVLKYFEENSVVMKSCESPTSCCENNFLSTIFIIVIVVIIIVFLAAVGLISIFCKCAKRVNNNGRNVYLVPIPQNAK